MYHVGLIAGTGWENAFETNHILDVKTEWGKPSSPIRILNIEGYEVAFINRHGDDHAYAPHNIPYQANILAMKNIGVSSVIGISSTGLINLREMKVGDILILDDFDRGNWNITIYKQEVVHTPMAEPYSHVLRDILIKAGNDLMNGKNVTIHDHGVYYATKGPSFETKTEIKRLKILGYDVVGMTQAPEVICANEAGLQYAGIATTDNAAAGLGKGFTYEEIRTRAEENRRVIIELLRIAIPTIYSELYPE